MPGTPRTANRTPAAVAWTIVGLAAIAYGLTIYLLTRARWASFDVSLFDYGKMAAILEGPFRPGVPYPDDHYYFVWSLCPHVPFLFPFYALLRSPAVLFAFQALVFGACVPILFLVGRRTFRGPWAALAVPLVFVLSPLAHAVASFGFKGENLFLPLLFLAWILVEEGRLRGLTWVAAAAFLTKVDALPVLVLSAALLWFRRRAVGKRLFLIAGVLGAAFALAFAATYLLAPVPPRWGQFHVGAFPEWSALLAAAREQLVLLGQWGFLPLLAPEVLAAGAVNLVYLVATAPAFHRIPEVEALLTFASPLVPRFHTEHTYLLGIGFLAFAVGLRRALRPLRLLRLSDRGARLAEGAIALLLVVLAGWIHVRFTPRELGPVPLAPDFDARAVCPAARSAAAWRMVDRLPEDEPGVVDLATFERAYRTPWTRRVSSIDRFTGEYGYALFDVLGFSADLPRDAYLARVREAVGGGHLRVETFEHGFLFLTRGTPDARNQEVLRFLDEHGAWLAANHRDPREAEADPALAAVLDAAFAPAEPGCLSGWLAVLSLGGRREP